MITYNCDAPGCNQSCGGSLPKGWVRVESERGRLYVDRLSDMRGKEDRFACCLDHALVVIRTAIKPICEERFVDPLRIADRIFEYIIRKSETLS